MLWKMREPHELKVPRNLLHVRERVCVGRLEKGLNPTKKTNMGREGLKASFKAGLSAMTNKMWIFQILLLLQYHLVVAMGVVQEKAESATPVTTFSPPEGNTTFLGGTTWCVASAGASQGDLQNALDWACGLGMADCSPIQEGGACFEPDTLLSHASYAFNNYYQQNGNSDIACNFGGTAALTARDPSYSSCLYSAAGPVASSSMPQFNLCCVWWELFGIFVLLFYPKHL